MAIRLFDEQGNFEKTLLITHTVAWHVDTLAECIGALPDPGLGLPENITKRRWQKWKGGGYNVNAVYEGVQGTADPSKADVGFYPSFKEAKLLTNPNFQALLKKYGGSYDPFTNAITWQSSLKGTGGGGFAGATGATGTSNPMFGQDSYIELACIFRRTRISQVAPLDALTRFAKILSALPAEAGGIPTPPGRNWFVMPPTIERRGSVWTDQDEWMLSPPDQLWNTDVYDFISV